MDNKKDTEYKTDEPISLNREDYFPFLLGKSEKLSSAVYLVTSLVSDMEPMKWVARERALSLLSDISAAEHAPLSDRMMLFETAEETAKEISSLIAIARAGGIISPMNADILVAAFNSLREAIGRGIGVPTSAESIVFELLKGEEKSLLEQANTYKGQKDTMNVSDSLRKGQPLDIYKTGGDTKGHVGTNGQAIPTEKIKADRRENIVDFVRRRKEVTIKDVLQVVLGCSEKTVQREITALVKDNVLKKEGERRWSKYSLK